MDLKEISKTFKEVAESLEKTFDEQHPYSGPFQLSKYGWQSVEIHSGATASWVFSLMLHIDKLERRLIESEKKIQELENKAVFI